MNRLLVEKQGNHGVLAPTPKFKGYSYSKAYISPPLPIYVIYRLYLVVYIREYPDINP